MRILLNLLICLFNIYRCGGVFWEYTIFIKAGHMECFAEELQAPQEIDIDYQVMYDREIDIGILFFDPHKNPLIANSKKNRDSLSLNLTENGVYQLCFDNRFSRTTSKAVYFSLRSVDPNMQDEGIQFDILKQDTAYSEILSELRDRFRKIYVNLEHIQRFQQYDKIYESRDRALLERNSYMVRVCSIAVMSLMLLTGFLQVYLIRSLFNDRSRVGRVLRK